MRAKAIIIGAMAVVAVATLTVNAQNAASKTTARGSVATLLAATTRVAVEREDLSVAERATASPAAGSQATPKPEEKTDVDTEATEPKITITAGCQAAIAHLKDLHAADVTEDAKERVTAEQESAGALAAEQTEDAAEAQPWKAALAAARTACAPQLPAGCRSAIAGLETTLDALHTEELGELQARLQSDLLGDFGAVRTAFSAVQAACPSHAE